MLTKRMLDTKYSQKDVNGDGKYDGTLMMTMIVTHTSHIRTSNEHEIGFLYKIDLGFQLYTCPFIFQI